MAGWLPAGAAVHRSEDTAMAWTDGEHLTTLAYDALRVANWQRGGDDKVPHPEPTPRPGWATPDKTAIAVDQIERVRERQERRRRELAEAHAQKTHDEG